MRSLVWFYGISNFLTDTYHPSRKLSKLDEPDMQDTLSAAPRAPKGDQKIHPWSPLAQRIEALSLYGSRWALSEDSGFKSYPSRPEVYLVQNVVR